MKHELADEELWVMCPSCKSLEYSGGNCPICGYVPFSVGRSGFRALLFAIVIGIPLAGLGWKILAQLRQKSGVQWDSEMQGAWVRTSSEAQSGISIYRIHITNQSGQALDEKHREFHGGDKIAATMHLRTQRTGSFQPRLTFAGPGSISPKEGPILTFRRGDMEEFHSSLLVTPLPKDAKPGTYKIRLEVEELDRKSVAFWETDITIK